jgi:2-dehydro-3-deoxy-D-gluconate 5-dehydrogenase
MQLPSMRVDGKIALVTGAGSGLGQAIACGLAQAGADVAVTEQPGRESAAAETVGAVEAAKRRAGAWPLDVTRLATIAEVVAQVIARFGRIDLLVNNAGINVPRLALEVTEEDWDRVLDVNLKGAFFMAQAVAKQALLPQGGGKVINIASQNGVVGMHHRAAYCSSKAGLVNLTRVLALEWARYHINVNAVGPTFIDTPLTRPMFADPAFRDEVLRNIPLGRIGQPEDVAGAVVFLASPAADMVTGHTLLVDGGWTAG